MPYVLPKIRPMILLYIYLAITLLMLIFFSAVCKFEDGIIPPIIFAVNWPIVIAITIYVVIKDWRDKTRKACSNGHDYWPTEINGRKVLKCRRCGHVAII